MRLFGRAAALCSVVFLVAFAGIADDKTADRKDSDAPAAAVNTPAAKAAEAPPNDAGATLEAPAPAPAPAPASGDIYGRPKAEQEAPRWNPMPAWNGNEGLFTLETGETLPRGAFDFTAGVNKISRMPGDITVLQAGPALGIGVNRWLSLFAQINAHEHIHVDTPSFLSLNVPFNPSTQFQNTIYQSIFPATGFRPAYVEDFPFASHNGGGVGEYDLGFKIGLMSERRGGPFSFSIRNDFYIPTSTSFNDLVKNEVQYGKFGYGIGAEVSKHVLHRSIVAVVNLGYRFTPDSSFMVTVPVTGGGTTTQVEHLRLSDQFSAGVGLLMFPQKRIQVITEYSATLFVGNGIPNTTFGARDPVDSVEGVRLYLLKNVALDAGYRYSLSLSQHVDRNGFVAKLGFAFGHRGAGAPAETAGRPAGGGDSLTSNCAVDLASVAAGGVVQAMVNAIDTQGHPLNYSWTATGGTINGSGPYARWDSKGVAPGSYTLTVRIDDGAGQTSTCSSNVTVR